MIHTVLFDLDGTLLPMDQDVFVRAYFGLLVKKLAPHGYDPRKLIDAVWAGVDAMVKNDGRCMNDQVFWNTFTERFGAEAKKDIPIFEEFYRNEFSQAASSCGFAPEAKQTVQSLKERGCRVILATNPAFPAVATENRMRWAGLEPEDFEWYTTYENIGYSKPNPDYYREILRKSGCEAGACLMVGNDVEEDMVAETVGMHVFLLTDCLINRAGKDISVYPHGGFTGLRDYLNQSC